MELTRRSPDSSNGPAAHAGTSGGCWEIEEVPEETVVGIAPASTSCDTKAVNDVDDHDDDGDDVYVAVGKGSSSVDALSWALTHVANKPSSVVYLVHVFPAVHHIPTPLGMLPKDQVSQAQVDSYMHQERAKRRDMLQKFLRLCENSKVKYDTCLIESDQTVKAVIELIPVLHIKRLIVGTSKSNVRSMTRLKRGSCKAAQIQKSAPDYCEVMIICDGRQVTAADQSMSSSPASDTPDHDKKADGETRDRTQGTVTCRCFPIKFL